MSVGPKLRQYCGRKTPAVILEVDHVVPLSDGGRDEIENLATSCWDCNRGKGATSLGVLPESVEPHDRAVVAEALNRWGPKRASILLWRSSQKGGR